MTTDMEMQRILTQSFPYWQIKKIKNSLKTEKFSVFTSIKLFLLHSMAMLPISEEDYFQQ